MLANNDDSELEDAMAAFPLEQMISNLTHHQQPVPHPSPSPITANNVLPFLPTSFHPATSSSPNASCDIPLPPPCFRHSLFPPPPPPPPLPPPRDAICASYPASGFSSPPATLPLAQLFSEWQHLQADWRCGSPSLLNDPYEVCHAIIKHLMDDIGHKQTATKATLPVSNSQPPWRAVTETHKQVSGIYCELMKLLDLPSSPFSSVSLSSLRAPPPYEPALLHHLACIAYNTALTVDDWSMAAYFVHFALALFALPDVPLPADVVNCTSSLSLYLIALLDELAAREKSSAHAVYGEAMLRVLQGLRKSEEQSGSNGELADMLELQARMYIASGRRQWAEEERKKQKADRKDNKKRKHRSQRHLSHSQHWKQAKQNELDEVRHRLLALLAQRTLQTNKCEQLLAVAFHLQLDELQRPLAEHLVCHHSAHLFLDRQLHYLELLCMLSSNEELFVFASSTLASASFASLHFRWWQNLCERCWTAGTVLVRGGPSELGERLLAVGIRLLERACQCDASEKIGSQLDGMQVLVQLNDMLTYVRERDKQHQAATT